jgi:hypothetical protein
MYGTINPIHKVPYKMIITINYSYIYHTPLYIYIHIYIYIYIYIHKYTYPKMYSIRHPYHFFLFLSYRRIIYSTLANRGTKQPPPWTGFGVSMRRNVGAKAGRPVSLVSSEGLPSNSKREWTYIYMYHIYIYFILYIHIFIYLYGWLPSDPWAMTSVDLLFLQWHRWGGSINGGSPIAGWFIMEKPKIR